MIEAVSKGPVRRPWAAGRFYPSNRLALERMVRELLAASGEAPDPRLRVLVAPHAGYPYSGPTAAHAYGRIAPDRVGRVFLLGRSHHYRFDGLSLPESRAFETPLGSLPVDDAALGPLRAAWSHSTPEAHDGEHTLEVHLPFLQVLLGSVPIVPILFGSPPDIWQLEAGRTIAAQMTAEDLLVVSTDLSHFLSESEANTVDQASLNLVLQQSPEAVCAGDASGACAMCGASAVVAGMAAAIALEARDWKLLDYRTSGPVSGDFDRVVGYGALAMAHAA